MLQPSSLTRDITPPIQVRRKSSQIAALHSAFSTSPRRIERPAENEPATLAAIEAGEAQIRDHLTYFAEHLAAVSRPDPKQPRLSIEDFKDLYQQNQHPGGRHFVVHQHDCWHDLRLQFSPSSSVSFAIPYGLPGNPNSRRQGRMTIETRVHNLWNNLIESASHATGSLLIWDTGEYELLERHPKLAETDDESTNTSDAEADNFVSMPPNQKLIEAFQASYIRLRLHGTRLPLNYTIILRLPSTNNVSKQPGKSTRKRRRKGPSRTKITPESTESDTDNGPLALSPPANVPLIATTPSGAVDKAALANPSEEEDEEYEQVRKNNAYLGASNTIGSVHQRRWFLTLDKKNSGFTKVTSGKDKGKWVREMKGDVMTGFQTFFVRGAEVERSVITGRTSAEVMGDEGVEGFRPRKMWIPILE